MFPKILVPSLGICSRSHKNGLWAPVVLSSSPLIGLSDEGQWLFCLYYLPGGLTGPGQVCWASWITGSKYSLIYIGGKTFGPLSMTLTPAQCHSEEEGKRKEAMDEIKGAEICPWLWWYGQTYGQWSLNFSFPTSCMTKGRLLYLSGP